MIQQHLKTSTFDFTDIVKKEKNKYNCGNTECPKCHGYGGWNLRIDAYGKGKHFQCFCNQCWGYGYVKEEDAKCIHDFKELTSEECINKGLPRLYMHDHVIECTKCGRRRSYDSSG